MSHQQAFIKLLSHPTSQPHAIQQVLACATLQDNACLSLCYQLLGNPAELRLPEKAPAERADALWQHTCCEVFVRRDGENAYREFNFSPSGQWAAYSFVNYRMDRSEINLPTAPQINVRSNNKGVFVDILLPANALQKGSNPLLLALSVVVEEQAAHGSNHHTYWALCHPGLQPDFHHPASFTLLIDTPPLHSESTA